MLMEAAVIIGDCHICQDCYNANYYTCSSCGKEDLYIEDIWFKDGEPMCEHCYFPDEEEDERKKLCKVIVLHAYLNDILFICISVTHSYS